jgi:predicted RNase H-like HicB family nuclease
MRTFHIPLRIVFYIEDGDWVAHCLEFDLLGDGRTKEEALEMLVEAIGLQLEASLENESAGNLFSPAPGKYFEMFAAGKNTAVSNLSVCIEDLSQSHPEPYVVEEVQVREYRERDSEYAPA